MVNNEFANSSEYLMLCISVKMTILTKAADHLHLTNLDFRRKDSKGK